MTRSVIRRADWLIAPDTAEGAPPEPLHEMECTTCPTGPESRSPATSDVCDAQDWAMGHAGLHRGHDHFREIVTRFWRTSLVNGP